MDTGAYLDRIGLDADERRPASLATLAELQRAHVTTVPFETLSITGDPHGDRAGRGVSIAREDCYEKIVDRRRGGFCFELNGAFTWLLRDRGFDADRVAARVISDGDRTPPANHHSIVVTLDRRYIVDVGLGLPKLRRPLPLDGTVVTDAGGDWRVVDSDRPDADWLVQYRANETRMGGRQAETENDDRGDGTDETRGGTDEWTDRYDLTETPRELSYFRATCDYLQTAPESPFTGEPTVTIGTERGHKQLSTDRFSETVAGETTERSVSPDEWHDVLEREFGLTFVPSAADVRRG